MFSQDFMADVHTAAAKREKNRKMYVGLMLVQRSPPIPSKSQGHFNVMHTSSQNLF